VVPNDFFGTKSKPTILLEPHKKVLPQANWHVWFCCTNEVCYIKYFLLKDSTVYRKEYFPSKESDIKLYRVDIYHQLLFKQNLLRKDCWKPHKGCLGAACGP